MSDSTNSGQSERGLSRRKFFVLGGAGIAAAGLGTGALVVSGGRKSSDGTLADERVPFFGENQSGIVTPAQDRLHFAAFDLVTTKRSDVVELLRRWTEAAEQLTRGAAVGRYGAVDGLAAAPPDDTGEALDLPPSRLTITFGFGRSLFVDREGNDRFGIGGRLPKGLIDLPHFPGDRLDPARSNGDLCIQACADDPQVAVHAVRNLARIAFGSATVRWSQLGFGRTSSTSTSQITPRNLFGFKDGTANLKAENAATINEHVWVQPADDQSWLANGTYLVARRISMRIETWDRTSLGEQEAIFGRQKSSGAPLSGGDEFAGVDFAMMGRNDEPIVAQNAHVRLAHPTSNNGHAMLRRGYNFTDGTDGLGRLDAGLFFLAFVRDPVNQYVPLQNRLAREDALSEYLQHTGSALFVIPPGVSSADAFIGVSLFA